MNASLSAIELALLIANLLAPVALGVLLWRRARGKDPGFRIQFSVAELWLIGISASPIGLIAVKVARENSVLLAAAVALMLLEFHALTWFVVNVIDRLTSTFQHWHRPLVLLAAVAGAWLGAPLVCTGISFLVVLLLFLILILWPFFLLMFLVVYGMRYLRKLR